MQESKETKKEEGLKGTTWKVGSMKRQKEIKQGKKEGRNDQKRIKAKNEGR